MSFTAMFWPRRPAEGLAMVAMPGEKEGMDVDVLAALARY
jgi:hypothetical protein